MTDSSDQKHIRETVAAEIQAVMDRHQVGGVILLCSRESAAWRFVFPTWSALQSDPVYGARLRASSKIPGDAERLEAAMHMIGSLRDMTSDAANVFGSLWRQAKRAIEAGGGSVEHTPHGGPGSHSPHGIFPKGRSGG